MDLVNGALAKNVYWAVQSSATLNTTAELAGTIIALTSVTLDTGATVKGRIMAINGAVTMDTNSVDSSMVSQSPCTAATPTPGGPTFSPTATTFGTATPTQTAGSATPTPIVGSATPTPMVGSFTPTLVATLTNSPVETATPVNTATHSPVETATPVNTATPSPVETATPLNTATRTPSPTAVPALTATPTRTPTHTPVPPTPGATPVVAPHSYFYPSPVMGDSGTIAYPLRSAANVTIRIYNVTGRQVDSITEAKAGGWQASQVSVGRFASGTYYYVITAQYQSGGSEVQAPRKFAVLH